MGGGGEQPAKVLSCPHPSILILQESECNMAEASLPIQTDIKTSVRSGLLSTVSRVMKYMILKMVMIFATVVVGVYLTIIIANMGGYVDRIQRGIIEENISNQVVNNPDFKLLAADVRKERITEMTRLAEKRAGLDQPFLIRSFRFLSDALTLNLGRAIYMNSDGGSKQVRLILLERLPSTLVLFATENILNFFGSSGFNGKPGQKRPRYANEIVRSCDNQKLCGGSS